MARLYYVEYVISDKPTKQTEGEHIALLGLRTYGPYFSQEQLERNMFNLVRNCQVNLEHQYGVCVPSPRELFEKIGVIDFDGRLVSDEAQVAA